MNTDDDTTAEDSGKKKDGPGLGAKVLGVFVVLAVLGWMFGGDDDPEPETAGASVAHTDEDKPARRQPPKPSPSPSATWNGTCTYLLGDHSDNTATGYRFVAQGDVVNDGNVGVTVDVLVEWDQIGTDPITETKQATVGVGDTVTVKFDRPVSGSEISRIQQLPTDSQCEVTPTITSTFGTVRP